MTFVSANLASSCMRNGSLNFSSFFFLAPISTNPITQLHVSVNGALIFGTQKTRVVLCKVFLLASTDLATHDESGAELDCLRMDESTANRILSLFHLNRITR